ncbi:cyclic nucleotide-binding domain-containing protein [uncultured Ilyobacter sp.]|uniref:Crp/Fnr family transcriptional regulator n=1 Tax=uncultured Ilyobacter sp. TaxID=544433 RepID=UPI002AA678AB|nr:cyclic nucleotide-binding domain-containing protein [uncultured Ilyobacter sp.]
MSKKLMPLLNTDDIFQILNKISIFGGLDDKQLGFLFEILKQSNYKKGEYIFRQGEVPSNIYIIQKGRVRFIEELDMTPYQIFEFGEGNCIGEASVLSRQPHVVSAVACEDTVIMVLSKEDFFKIFKKDKNLFSILILNIAREICRRLKSSDDVLLHYIDKNRCT